MERVLLHKTHSPRPHRLILDPLHVRPALPPRYATSDNGGSQLERAPNEHLAHLRPVPRTPGWEHCDRQQRVEASRLEGRSREAER